MDSRIDAIEKRLVAEPFNHYLRLEYAQMLQAEERWDESLDHYSC
jgi:thioredoxin-like negative regulator of GroEL